MQHSVVFKGVQCSTMPLICGLVLNVSEDLFFLYKSGPRLIGGTYFGQHHTNALIAHITWQVTIENVVTGI